MERHVERQDVPDGSRLLCFEALAAGDKPGRGDETSAGLLVRSALGVRDRTRAVLKALESEIL